MDTVASYPLNNLTYYRLSHDIAMRSPDYTASFRFRFSPSLLRASQPPTLSPRLSRQSGHDAERADIVRRSVNTIFQQAQPPTPSITIGQQEALNSLKEGVVLSCDKGRASVILHADTYHAKTSTLIDVYLGNRVTYAGEDQTTR